MVGAPSYFCGFGRQIVEKIQNGDHSPLPPEMNGFRYLLCCRKVFDNFWQLPYKKPSGIHPQLQFKDKKSYLGGNTRA
jgi:hypothetical protein